MRPRLETGFSALPSVCRSQEQAPSVELATFVRVRVCYCREASVAATTIVNVEEQMRGWLAAIAMERTLLRQMTAYRARTDLFTRLRLKVDPACD
jgi:hypothetical protein